MVLLLISISRQQLRELAHYLDSERENILQQWRIATENSQELTIASSLTRLQFHDHIPGVLDALGRRLTTWPHAETAEAVQQEKDQVTEHGLQRWQQGYQLRELTREWGHLQRSLAEALESYSSLHPHLQPDVMVTARRALADLCWEGITDSTTQYWRLQQAEAAGHVRDLERAIATVNEIETARAEAWREAAHDLRGSVAVVSTAASMLKLDVPEEAKEEFSDLLHRGVSSLHDMLTELMDLARLEAGQELRNVAPFDAAVLMQDFCTNSLTLAHQRNLTLKMEGPASLPVEGDRAKVLRILQNLLLNALKYTERGGVTVIWGEVEDPDEQGWMFCVQDTGPGLNQGPGAPLARQIYEATQTAHRVEDIHGDSGDEHSSNAPTAASQSHTLPASQLPGEGIGLSIVKRLCELLDASIEMETSLGEGSTFRVVLPREYQASQRPLKSQTGGAS